MSKWENLIAINRNQNGDYYFIYEIKKVINHIKPGTKPRNELIIVGVPKKRLIEYLNNNEKIDKKLASLQQKTDKRDDQ